MAAQPTDNDARPGDGRGDGESGASPDLVSEFQTLLDRLGVDLGAWPSADQQRGREILAASADAVTLLRQTAALWDRTGLEPVKAPPGLAQRIVDRALSKDK